MAVARSRSRSYQAYLLDLAGVENNRDRYIAMLLDTIEFRWSLNMDENRAGDGLALREGYDERTGPCTVLEMLLGLADRMSYILSDLEKPLSYFYHILIENLGLDKTEQNYEIEDIIEKFMDREYSPNGRGGLFPLRRPFGNQKKVEIWYQMMGWIDELN